MLNGRDIYSLRIEKPTVMAQRKGTGAFIFALVRDSPIRFRADRWLCFFRSLSGLGYGRIWNSPDSSALFCQLHAYRHRDRSVGSFRFGQLSACLQNSFLFFFRKVTIELFPFQTLARRWMASCGLGASATVNSHSVSPSCRRISFRSSSCSSWPLQVKIKLGAFLSCYIFRPIDERIKKLWSAMTQGQGPDRNRLSFWNGSQKRICITTLISIVSLSS